MSIFKIKFLVLLVLLSNEILAQQHQNPLPNWQNMDLEKDGVFGMSTEKAYVDLLKAKTSLAVTVAVIDGGVDLNHEDLKGCIWTNFKEIADNGKDDDCNGFIDDIKGWNFLGSSKGSFQFDNIEQVRELRAAIKKSPESPEVKILQMNLDDKRQPIEDKLKEMEVQRTALLKICERIGKNRPSIEEFKNYRYRSLAEANALIVVVHGLKADVNFMDSFENRYRRYKDMLNYHYNINYDPRAESKEYNRPYYGNNDIKGLNPIHGTHIAGIIAANRYNEIGIKGIVSKAKIMSIRAVPDGNAIDFDISMAIRYAVDNGAKVLNISEGKMVSPDKRLVDQAVRYAMEKGVLIVHAAGNDGRNLESELGFPSRNYLDGGRAESWIEVGATGPNDDEHLLTWFSNYGSKAVDVMAPGLDIYSTYPENRYKLESGTSMAAPMVSGVAALLWSYYPNLTALQVKKIIMESVIKVNHPIKNKSGESLDFRKICLSGGIVNVYNAIKLAENIR